MTARVNVKVKRLTPTATLPAYMTEGAVGMDVHADEDVTLYAFESRLVKTGLAFEIPQGYELQVRPRSGLAVKHEITVLNSPGTVDSDYRGEIKVLLANHGSKKFVVQRGDRIAQLVLAPVLQAAIEEVSVLSDTSRGTGGFGSTGV